MPDTTHTPPHPAIALILDAEGTGAFRHNIPAVESILATATGIEPETLPPVWVTRLALRLTDLMLESVQLDRAKIWLDTTQKHLNQITDDPSATDLTLRHRVQNIRYLILDQRWNEAREAIAKIKGQLAQTTPPAPPAQHARVALLAAELHAVERHFPFVQEVLEPHLNRENAFETIDELWRALGLSAQAHQMCFEFEAATEFYIAIQDLCTQALAHEDANDALLGLGQCQLGQGLHLEGIATISKAAANFPEQRKRHAHARIIGAHLAAGDIEGALASAESSASEAAKDDDFDTYVSLVGIITSLMRSLGRHKDAYRNLVTIHGFFQARFGPDATEPIKRLINTIKEDLGNDDFQALSTELLAEMRQQSGA